jgi:hypothetical protein
MGEVTGSQSANLQSEYFSHPERFKTLTRLILKQTYNFQAIKWDETGHIRKKGN